MPANTKKNALSLRLLLTVPYVILVIMLASVLGVLSYQAGSRAIGTLTDQLLLETVGRITQAVDRHIVGSGAVLETAFPDGMPAPKAIESDLENLRTRFWIATALHTDPNDYVYYGNESGQNLGLMRLNPDQVEMRLKLQENERRAIYHYEGIDGSLEFVRREQRVFDPRTRPWYADGRDQEGHTWTSVYIDFGTRELVATRARRVLALDGSFEGVVATDVSLKALNDFVGQLRVSPNGIAFIIEPNGALIASSASPNVVRLPDGEYKRASASDSDHAILRKSYDSIIRHISTHGISESTRALSVPIEGALIHIAFDRIRDDAGLDWITVVAMPDSDFMSGITDNIRRTIYIALFAVLLTVAIGLGILNWVAGDLRRLKEAARRVGEGQLDAPVGIHRRDELGELARSFETMQLRLQTDELTGLLNREAFTLKLRSRIAAYGGDRRKRRFAVLFIDLNKFKQVNDELGHDAGDLALKEVANRLRESLRTEDLVARYAGDEFVILLDNIDASDHFVQARSTIQRIFSEPLESVGTENKLELGASVGIAVYPDDATDAEALLRIADGIMYDHKLGDRKRTQDS
ncbi:sensor domain-containing diguanylate cyclase [Azoarcus taiwanensis]|uniref:Diguanylate cyclase n=1 Tax=Azoarcus taiwanensis TaxID=666964 RepID=A0A972FJW3_9RHOO|nr:sensor domain-containing diguanylate cyclase [Azoarcus taiwanensis]NMG03646.1 diguanylate cyclase [Azoarcus taiwanensis]